MYNMKYQERQNLLKKLNFNITSIGFKYWIKAIDIYKKDSWRYGFTIEYLYNIIADYFQTTRTRVERAMRTASQNAKKTIAEKYNYNGKLSTKVILELICNYQIELYPKVKNLKSEINYQEVLNHIPIIEDKQKEELYKYFY